MSPTSSRRFPAAAVLAPSLVGVGLVALTAVLWAAGGVVAAPLGLPDPGALTRWGLPLLGWLEMALAVVVVACLMVPALTMRRSRDRLLPLGARAVRTSVVAAAGWLVVVVATVWFTVSDQFAQPVTEVTLTTVRGFLSDAPQGTSLGWQFGLVLALTCTVSLIRTPAALCWVSRWRSPPWPHRCSPATPPRREATTSP